MSPPVSSGSMEQWSFPIEWALTGLQGEKNKVSHRNRLLLQRQDDKIDQDVMNFKMTVIFVSKQISAKQTAKF